MTHDNFLSDEIRAINTPFVQSVVNTIDNEVAWEKLFNKCDELIAYIDDSTDGLKHEDIFPLLIDNTNALRAVVELHKPEKVDYPNFETRVYCQECRSDVDEGLFYPCRTIQAIEKELK